MFVSDGLSTVTITEALAPAGIAAVTVYVPPGIVVFVIANENVVSLLIRVSYRTGEKPLVLSARLKVNVINGSAFG